MVLKYVLYRRFPRPARAAFLLAALVLTAGCERVLMQWTDRDVARLIEARQRATLGGTAPAQVGDVEDVRPGRSAYQKRPSPTTPDVPPEFTTPSTAPATLPATTTQPTSAPTARRETPLTLTQVWAYAQRYQREYQSAKEDLYLAALALTLERHLWTPQFAANLRTVYGNYGEIRDFDQAMRFVADLSVAQRLPYGGRFTAQGVSTLIRDVKKSITAEEGSTAGLNLEIPFLRGAGHVARETLLQLERDLTYAVRTFERFRRRQLVLVAQSYFDLLRTKQQITDSEATVRSYRLDYQRASAMEAVGRGTRLDTDRAEQALLSAAANLEDAREAFRAAADEFKILIGMPVNEPLNLGDLEDIESIERQVAEGFYPLLQRPVAVDNEAEAVEIGLRRRLDLITLANRVDDARRGVAVNRNSMLPDLNWNSSVTFDTDPNSYRLSDFSFERATWRSEIVLSLPLERTAERNRLRQALISVQQAQRAEIDQAERIRADIRRAVNRILAEERLLQIQQRNVEVAEQRREYARIQYANGDIGNRDLFEAEDGWTAARNRLNQAKTARWGAILQFRLATETLLVEEDGTQIPPQDLVTPTSVPAP